MARRDGAAAVVVVHQKAVVERRSKHQAEGEEEEGHKLPFSSGHHSNSDRLSSFLTSSKHGTRSEKHIDRKDKCYRHAS